MSRSELQAKLDEIRALRTEVLQYLQDVPDSDTDLETPAARTWRNLGIILLRFGDHMREHGNQIAGIRQAVGRGPTDVQRKLGAAEAAWGELLGAVAGLTDADLDAVPETGGWSMRETLDHILQAEAHYLDAVRSAFRQRASEG